MLELDAVELDVLRVTSWGEDLSFHNDGQRLRVDFDETLALGEIKEVAIEYQTRPRRGLYFVGPDVHYPDKPQQVWSQGQDIDSRYWGFVPEDHIVGKAFLIWWNFDDFKRIGRSIN